MAVVVTDTQVDRVQIENGGKLQAPLNPKLTMHELYITGIIIHKIIVILAIVHVLMGNRQPARTMAWVLVIYFVPVIGIVLYIFFGIDTRKERLISERSLNQLAKRSMFNFVGQQELRLPEEHKQTIDLFINQNLSLPFKDNKIDIYTDGYGFFTALLAAIAGAKRHIHIDIYIFADDPLGRLVADALIQKARQGVEVRLIYDDVGCWNVPCDFFERMREEGIEVHPFLPVRFPSFTSKVNYRNHRKIIIIDGTTGFTGGMNIAMRYVKGSEGQAWRDTMVKISGSGVYALQRVFLVDWYFVDRTLISDRKYYPHSVSTVTNDCLVQIVTSSPVSPYPEIMQGYLRVIMGARQYIYIETPYFIPTEPILFALKTAAQGGIDVRLIVPMQADAKFVGWAGRAYLREIMNAGVKVFLYAAGFIHSKILICDDSLSTCGSTNVDFRSFENNFEANAFFYDRDTAMRFKSIFLRDQESSVMLESVSERISPRFTARLWESVTRLLSPLL